MKRVCVFCGSSRGARGEYPEAATAVGRELARRGIELVYGGGSVGLMGRLANATMEAGGRVIGVIPRALLSWEVAHGGLTSLEIVESMHARKARMAELADGFLALPGGFGTFEELFEVLTWAQLGLHPKPCGMLNVAGYFTPLFGLLDHAVEEGFLRPQHRSLVLGGEDVQEVLTAMSEFVAPEVEKWIDRDST